MTGKRLTALLSVLLAGGGMVGGDQSESPLKIAVSFGPEISREPVDGRLLLLLSEVPGHWRRLGAIRIRELDRWMGIARRPDTLS